MTQLIRDNSVLLTGRRVVWSPRFPRFSLQAGEGGAEEAAKAGPPFPREGPPPPEALSPGCLKTPTGRWRGGEETDWDTKTWKENNSCGEKGRQESRVRKGEE